jgi:hypothetical protein
MEGRHTIKMDLKEAGREGLDWIKVHQDRYQWWLLVKMVTNRFLKRQGIF